MNKKIVWLPYDFDTAIGITNEGTLAFSYNLEDIDTLEGGAKVFNGQDSVLWVNLRAAFFDDIKAMYQNLRSTGKLSYSKVEEMFEAHQEKWGEAIFNEDAQFKYLDPLINDGNGSYLSMLQGSKAEQRKWWLYNRFRYMDSKYNAGDALTDVVTLRGYAKDNVTVTPYADIYAAVKYGSYLVQSRAARNETKTLVCPLDSVNDTEIYIYSASQLASIGDISGLKVGYADFSNATRLTSLKIGDNTSGYSNANLTELYLGNNALLQSIDVRNCTALTQAVDLSGCTGLVEVDFRGTAITGLTLPIGGVLEELYVPSTVRNLTVRNQPELDTFVAGSSGIAFTNLSTLWLENAGILTDTSLDDVLDELATGAHIRLVGIYKSFEDASDAASWLSNLDDYDGLDEHGYEVTGARVSGTVHIEELTSVELAELQADYPDITFTYDTITLIVTFKNYDGTTLDTQTVVPGGNVTYSGSTPSRATDSQYMYTFAGWSSTNGGTSDSSILNNITEEKTVWAAYTTTAICTVTFKDYDGTVLDTQAVIAGNNATYGGTTPSRASTTQYTYTWSGWASSSSGTVDANILNNITESKTVWAIYTEATRLYTVTWKSESTTLETQQVTYGSSATYSGSTPTHSGTAADWRFDGWDGVTTNITEDTTVNAVWTSIAIQYVKFVQRSTSSLDCPTATSLHDKALYQWSSANDITTLTSINLPSVTSVNSYAFYAVGDPSNPIAEISLPSATTIGSYAFNAAHVAKANLPEATSIQSNAFYECKQLEYVSIPKATSIASNAFAGSSAGNVVPLTTLIVGSSGDTTVCTLSSTNALKNTNISKGTGYIYVPDDLVNNYKSASNWSTYASQIKGQSELPS